MYGDISLTCFGGRSLELSPEGQESHVAKETIVIRIERGVVGLKSDTRYRKLSNIRCFQFNKCRINGIPNFQGEKIFNRLVENEHNFHGMLNLSYRYEWYIHRENFRGWLLNRDIRGIKFSPTKVSHCTPNGT